MSRREFLKSIGSFALTVASGRLIVAKDRDFILGPRVMLDAVTTEGRGRYFFHRSLASEVWENRESEQFLRGLRFSLHGIMGRFTNRREWFETEWYPATGFVMTEEGRLSMQVEDVVFNQTSEILGMAVKMPDGRAFMKRDIGDPIVVKGAGTRLVNGEIRYCAGDSIRLTYSLGNNLERI